MWAGMRKVRREGGLRVGTPLCGNAAGGSTCGTGAIRPDCKPHSHFAAGIFDRNALRLAENCERWLGDPRQAALLGAEFECGDQVTILDIVAERIATDFRRGKDHFRRA